MGRPRRKRDGSEEQEARSRLPRTGTASKDKEKEKDSETEEGKDKSKGVKKFSIKQLQEVVAPVLLKAGCSPCSKLGNMRRSSWTCA